MERWKENYVERWNEYILCVDGRSMYCEEMERELCGTMERILYKTCLGCIQWKVASEVFIKHILSGFI